MCHYSNFYFQQNHIIICLSVSYSQTISASSKPRSKRAQCFHLQLVITDHKYCLQKRGCPGARIGHAWISYARGRAGLLIPSACSRIINLIYDKKSVLAQEQRSGVDHHSPVFSRGTLPFSFVILMNHPYLVYFTSIYLLCLNSACLSRSRSALVLKSTAPLIVEIFPGTRCSLASPSPL